MNHHSSDESAQIKKMNFFLVPQSIFIESVNPETFEFIHPHSRKNGVNVKGDP